MIVAMGDVTRLDRCYRCRKVFAARQGERYCPDCRREVARERNRRRLGLGGFAWTHWSPVLVLVALVLAGGFFGRWGPLAGGVLGIAAAWYTTSLHHG